MRPLILEEVDMGAARSNDLRIRVVAGVAAGMSRRQAAARFDVSPSSAIRWAVLKAETGKIDPRPRGGKSRSPLEPHAAWLLELTAAEPDLTLEAMVGRVLEGLGLKISEISIRRFFKRHKISFKKNPARRRTGSARRGAGARALEGGPSRP